MSWLEGESAVHAALPEHGFHRAAPTALSASQPALLAFSSNLLGRIGSLDVRLAQSPDEVAAAQEVRYRVFYEELGARSDDLDASQHRDADRFDSACDHLLVLDTSLSGPDHRRIVGTYRLLRQEPATKAGGFYSEDEFELKTLLARHPDQRFLELGRSCVLPGYRSKRTIEVLWQGLWAYVCHHKVDVMTGCASFHGVVPAAHAESLSFLAQNYRARSDWDIRAVESRYCAMDLMPPEAINIKAALAAMPTLIKGYLRVGARVGDGCVVDHQFGTVDIFVVMPVKEIAARYISYYSGDGVRYAA